MNNIKKYYALTCEGISKMRGIGLKNAARTLAATTYRSIRSTDLLSNPFRTDKAQLHYKQGSWHYLPFYVNYIKVGVKYIWQSIGGTVYTNKLGLNTFFPCTDKSSEQAGYNLWNFIAVVGLSPILH